MLALGFAVPVSANHAQTDSGNVVAFDHVAGNEWWVEVALSGQDAGSVAKVEAQDTNGAWVTLAKKSWGPYAASFHVEPGNQVRFRASWAGGAQQVSCWFTHPAGLEQCSTPPPPGSFDATFTGVRGNEWWVQAQVATNGPAVARVDVREHLGGVWSAFQPVARQSWGWGASYHIPQGTIVQLRATATDGQTDLSSCRQWVPPSGQDAAIVACPGATPTPFDATFTGVKGNEWWVQVNVAGNQPIHEVAFRVDCRPYWEPLVKQDWGGWARSMHIPAGSKVDFQARTATYASDVSGGYTWTSATPTSGCPQGDWPRQGSRAAYDLSSGVCGGGECFSDSARLDMLYRDGRWINTCRGESRHTTPDGGESVDVWTSDNSGIAPSWLTPRTSVGAQVRPDMFHADNGGCSMGWTSSWLTVTGQVDHRTNLRDANGNLITLRAWEAVSDGSNGDNIYTAHWDVDTGMVLDVASNPRMSGQGSAYMTLVSTDAGLR